MNHDREAYGLAAGFALGLINLGRGHTASGMSHAHGGIVESLKSLVLGGAWGAPLLASAPPLSTQQRSSNRLDDLPLPLCSVLSATCRALTRWPCACSSAAANGDAAARLPR